MYTSIFPNQRRGKILHTSAVSFYCILHTSPIWCLLDTSSHSRGIESHCTAAMKTTGGLEALPFLILATEITCLLAFFPLHHDRPSICLPPHTHMYIHCNIVNIIINYDDIHNSLYKQQSSATVA